MLLRAGRTFLHSVNKKPATITFRENLFLSNSWLKLTIPKLRSGTLINYTDKLKLCLNILASTFQCIATPRSVLSFWELLPDSVRLPKFKNFGKASCCLKKQVWKILRTERTKGSVWKALLLRAKATFFSIGQQKTDNNDASYVYTQENFF